MRKGKKRILIAIVLISYMCMVAFLGKRIQREPISKTEIQLNTVVSITIYDSQNEQLLEGAMDLCRSYENIFSRTNPDSEVYQLNHGMLQKNQGFVQLSDACAEVVRTGLAYSKLSEGAFDLTIGPVTSLWDFTSGSKKIPDAKQLEQAVSLVDYKMVDVRENQVRFQKEGMQLEFGAIAKGYIADKIKEYLVDHGVKSATIDLGGNVLCIGKRPDGEAFRVGIQKPFAKRNETFATVSIEDRSVVSSGVYERYFEVDGKRYHHLLDPKTGYPCENDLVSVTVISDQSIDGDALSTTCFALGREAGMALINRIPNTQAVFVTENGDVYFSEQFEKEVELSYVK